MLQKVINSLCPFSFSDLRDDYTLFETLSWVNFEELMNSMNNTRVIPDENNEEEYIIHQEFLNIQNRVLSRFSDSLDKKNLQSTISSFFKDNGIDNVSTSGKRDYYEFLRLAIESRKDFLASEDLYVKDVLLGKVEAIYFDFIKDLFTEKMENRLQGLVCS